MKLLTPLIGLCLLAVPATAQEVQISLRSPGKAPGRAYSYWTVFAHPRFGFELPVPPGVRALSHPEAGADSTFVSMDGAFKMTAWGGLSPFPAATVLEREWKNAQQRAGRTISYGRKNAAGFVMSGVKNGHTRFYEKMIVQGDHVAAISMTLPDSRAREFARWVEGIDMGFALIADPDSDGPEMAAHALTRSTGVFHDAMLQVPDPLTNAEWRQADLLPGSGIQLEPQPAPGPPAARERDSTTVDVTPPEQAPPPATQTPPPSPELPVGESVPDKKGFVYSPFLAEKKLVDAVDIPSGTKVKCPYTGKVFRLP